VSRRDREVLIDERDQLIIALHHRGLGAADDD
jgi:hypothetical protein